MADSGGTLIKVVLLGGAAYLVYELFFAAPSTTATAAAPAAAAGSAAPPAPPAYNFNSLSNLFSRLQQYATADKQPSNAQLTGYQWTVYYNQTGGPQIDPSVVFGSVAAASAQMTIAQYWAAVSAWLAANKGLTGLGVYAGLGRLAYGRAY